MDYMPSIIKIYPEKSEPYYFQKTIGKYAVKGTKDISKATRLTHNEAFSMKDKLPKSLKYTTYEEYTSTTANQLNKAY